jgi:DNA-binding NarL/FixJ family response regulator
VWIVGVRVVAIDDSEVFLEAAGQVVEAVPGFRLIGCASSGEEGIELAAREHPDLVIVDLILPGIDGLETSKRLHALSPEPVVILCSIEDDPRLKGEHLACARDAFLPKAEFSRASLIRVWHEQTSAGDHSGKHA